MSDGCKEAVMIDDSGTKQIRRIQGRALPLRGNDIDTDRIIPARFLRSVRFEGLEDHIFEDDREALADGVHPFSNPVYQGAGVLLANANFACGSSREHAPQALQRWGIQVCLAESFSEIFMGNSTALGMPCVTASAQVIDQLMQMTESVPDTVITIDLIEMTASTGNQRLEIQMASAVRESMINGTWDATGLLLDQFNEVRAVASRLPYLQGFKQG